MRKSFLGATLVLLACAAPARTRRTDHDRGGPPPGQRAAPAGRAGRGPGPGPGRGGPGWSGGHARGYVDFDARYGHNHYYPSRGFVYGTLPLGAVSVGYGGGNYFFHGGVWFRPYGRRYVVVQPPLGIFLPVLPSDYATVWVGGTPYYYADGVYYNAAPGQGYVVVAPPPGAETAQTAAPARRRPPPIRSSIRATTRARRRPRPTAATATPGPRRSRRRWPTRRCSSAPPRRAWTDAATRCAERAARAGRSRATHRKRASARRPFRTRQAASLAGLGSMPAAVPAVLRVVPAPAVAGRGIPSPSPGRARRTWAPRRRRPPARRSRRRRRRSTGAPGATMQPDMEASAMPATARAIAFLMVIPCQFVEVLRLVVSCL